MSELQLPVPTPGDVPDVIQAIRDRTPAHILVGRAGPAYRTVTALGLRQDHAAAVDAVHAELDLPHDLIERWGLIEVQSCARDKVEFLMRPDLGRRLDPLAPQTLTELCPRGVDVQVVIGDGLSVAAVLRQVPALLPLLEQETRRRGWTFGRPFAVRHCRVGVMNDIGDLFDPYIVILLIGERPGLATAESLSAYLAYRPRPGHTDAQRNLISNIHARGVMPQAAAPRILALAERMRQMQMSGVAVKEDLSSVGLAALATPLPSPRGPDTK